MGIEDRVIPVRFLVTLGHLMGVLMVVKTKTDNIHAGLSQDASAAEVATAEGDVNVRSPTTVIPLLFFLVSACDSAAEGTSRTILL